jgi:hypothetical protein
MTTETLPPEYEADAEPGKSKKNKRTRGIRMRDLPGTPIDIDAIRGNKPAKKLEQKTDPAASKPKVKLVMPTQSEFQKNQDEIKDAVTTFMGEEKRLKKEIFTRKKAGNAEQADKLTEDLRNEERQISKIPKRMVNKIREEVEFKQNEHNAAIEIHSRGQADRKRKAETDVEQWSKDTENAASKFEHTNNVNKAKELITRQKELYAQVIKLKKLGDDETADKLDEEAEELDELIDKLPMNVVQQASNDLKRAPLEKREAYKAEVNAIADKLDKNEFKNELEEMKEVQKYLGGQKSKKRIPKAEGSHDLSEPEEIPFHLDVAPETRIVKAKRVEAAEKTEETTEEKIAAIRKRLRKPQPAEVEVPLFQSETEIPIEEIEFEPEAPQEERKVKKVKNLAEEPRSSEAVTQNADKAMERQLNKTRKALSFNREMAQKRKSRLEKNIKDESFETGLSPANKFRKMIDELIDSKLANKRGAARAEALEETEKILEGNRDARKEAHNEFLAMAEVAKENGDMKKYQSLIRKAADEGQAAGIAQMRIDNLSKLPSPSIIDNAVGQAKKFWSRLFGKR